MKIILKLICELYAFIYNKIANTSIIKPFNKADEV